MVCKLVDILNICVILAIIIEPDIAPHNDALSTGVVTEDHSYMNNLSSVNNASSYAIRNRRLLNPSKWQNV